MRVIRPAALVSNGHRRALLLALSMLASGVLAAELVLLAAGGTVAAVGILASVAALGLGVGAARLTRVISPNRTRSASELLASLLAPGLRRQLHARPQPAPAYP